MGAPFPEDEFVLFIDSLTKGLMREKDQMVKINAAVANHTFTCEQVKRIAQVTKMCWCSSVVACYPKIIDKDDFGEVLKVFKFDEEREEVCQKLGLSPDGSAQSEGSKHVRVAPSQSKAILKSDSFQQSYNSPRQRAPQPKRVFKVPGRSPKPSQESSKICTNCGDKLKLEQKFCGGCGTPSEQ